MTKEIRLGIYICHCGLNIAGVLDPEALAAQAKKLPGVAACRHHLYTCSEAGQLEIKKDIQKHKLNRLLLAACSPKLHEATFRRLLVEAGLNPYLLEMVNIREQCSWVHLHEPQAAQAKALELINMGLAKVRSAQPLPARQVPVTRQALVVGGGPAGLRAALDIANAGFPVVLVERQPILGGMANKLHRTFPQGETALSLINPLMAAVTLHPGIRVLTSSEITAVSGYVGNFQVTLRRAPAVVTDRCDLCGQCAPACPLEVPGEMEEGLCLRKAIYLPSPKAFPARYVVDREHCDNCGLCVPACPRQAIDLAAAETQETLDVGAMVVATGFRPFDPKGSRYESWAAHESVLTSVALERLLDPYGPTGGKLLISGAEIAPQDIAFVLCVGSREEEGNRYCSRVCCPTALKQALELKARFPEARLRIYYRDIRTTKKDWEELYTKAREAGILMIRGEVTGISTAADGRLVLTAHNELMGVTTEDRLDLAVLAVGMAPGNSQPLKEVLKLPVGEDGFFLEAHSKLRPLETVLDGVFLAGTCQGPKDLAETLAQASGAAAKVLGLFAHEAITLDSVICTVDQEKCVGCGTCLQECCYQAVEMLGEGKEKKARIIEAACKGCGACAGACPSGAVIARGFTDEMIFDQIDAALAMEPEKKILVFCCNWCSYAGADFAGVSRLQYSPAARIIRTMCAGRIHPKFILRAFELGAGQVLVSGCHPPGDCHYISGNLKAQARVDKLKPKLEKKGIDPNRLRLEWISATEGKVFQRVVQEMAAQLPAGDQEEG
ncbi:MAG: hydrogenase iron-sulfur subunit [Syntrophales bacterium]|nr:hydrogenase iron-sulfur subunit [Syntrophales bacterium]